MNHKLFTIRALKGIFSFLILMKSNNCMSQNQTAVERENSKGKLMQRYEFLILNY